MPNLPFLDPSVESSAGIPFLEASSIAFEEKANKGAPGGYAPLGNDGKVPMENLPSILDSSGLQQTAQKNQANGYAGLGSDGKISLTLLPDANALESEAIAFAVALG